MSPQGAECECQNGDCAEKSLDSAYECNLTRLTLRPSVVKRPLVEWSGGSVSVGVEPHAWARC